MHVLPWFLQQETVIYLATLPETHQKFVSLTFCINLIYPNDRADQSSYRIILHHNITKYYINYIHHNITSYYIILHHITSCYIILHHITSYYIIIVHHNSTSYCIIILHHILHHNITSSYYIIILHHSITS